ncbi:uncharacterized protein LOC112503447 [Cynara cardunculus var. scolymus]|uniref:uncharacterized protein LOC112503447 n=1 Tax=Cynara cardunculus var. scolymus TaxID=59895 RepID=UPI000D62B3E7|nr:uncharacterized protein LOC112503447 [Cynara cardunculus var. scolymus]
MTRNDDLLEDRVGANGETPVVIPNGDYIPVKGRGSSMLLNGIKIAKDLRTRSLIGTGQCDGGLYRMGSVEKKALMTTPDLIITSRDVWFVEQVFPFAAAETQRNEDEDDRVELFDNLYDDDTSPKDVGEEKPGGDDVEVEKNNDVGQNENHSTVELEVVNETESELQPTIQQDYGQREKSARTQPEHFDEFVVNLPPSMDPTHTARKQDSLTKDPQYYTETEKERVIIDKKALTYMLMAIPNELFNRVDSRGSVKELWDEFEQQMLGSEKSIQTWMNQCISAYEGFRARENETITESYNRFNVILNDLRRNGIQKSMSEINYKFLKNLSLEWNSLAVNLQMNKNTSKDDIHDLYSILYEQEETVRELTIEKKKTESESTDDSSTDSDDEIREFSKKLALLTQKSQKRFGKKKKFVKFEKSKGKEVKPEKFGKARDHMDAQPELSRWFNCGKPGHYFKDCLFKKFKDLNYYLKKANLAKALEDGKSLVAEDESYLIDSLDDEAAHITQVNMCLISITEVEGSSSENKNEVIYDSNNMEESTDQDWKVHPNPEFDLNLKKISDLEDELRVEKCLNIKAENDFLSKSKDFERKFSKLTLLVLSKDNLLASNLKKILDLEKELNSCYDERTKLMSKIIKLEEDLKTASRSFAKNSEAAQNVSK